MFNVIAVGLGYVWYQPPLQEGSFVLNVQDEDAQSGEDQSSAHRSRRTRRRSMSIYSTPLFFISHVSGV